MEPVFGLAYRLAKLKTQNTTDDHQYQGDSSKQQYDAQGHFPSFRPYFEADDFFQVHGQR